MKKLSFVTLIASTAILGCSLAQANVNPEAFHAHKPKIMQQQKQQKNMDLTSAEAQTLVQATIIKHGQDGKIMIQKTEIIKLDKNKTFYLIYVGASAQSASSRFFIVNAQNAQVMPFPHPKPKKLKKGQPNHAMKAQQFRAAPNASMPIANTDQPE